MQTQAIGMLFTGIILAVVGYLLTAKERIAAWGLNRGRARIWVKLLGQQRALKPTRYFFGPVTCIAGLLVLLAALATLISVGKS